jgi:hypothetical protein
MNSDWMLPADAGIGSNDPDASMRGRQSQLHGTGKVFVHHGGDQQLVDASGILTSAGCRAVEEGSVMISWNNGGGITGLLKSE